MGSMDYFDELKQRLKCGSFVDYIHRFEKLFFNAGMLPETVFHLMLARKSCLRKRFDICVAVWKPLNTAQSIPFGGRARACCIQERCQRLVPHPGPALGESLSLRLHRGLRGSAVALFQCILTGGQGQPLHQPPAHTSIYYYTFVYIDVSLL